jgi:hypothetical protein
MTGFSPARCVYRPFAPRTTISDFLSVVNPHAEKSLSPYIVICYVAFALPKEHHSRGSLSHTRVPKPDFTTKGTKHTKGFGTAHHRLHRSHPPSPQKNTKNAKEELHFLFVLFAFSRGNPHFRDSLAAALLRHTCRNLRRAVPSLFGTPCLRNRRSCARW